MITLLLSVLIANTLTDPLPPKTIATAHAQLQNLEAAMGSHLCRLGGPEHDHYADAMRAIAAGAVHLEPRVCHIERRGRSLVYRYRIVAVPIFEMLLRHDGEEHLVLSWEREVR